MNDYDPAKLLPLIKNSKVTIIDVRTPMEVSEGTISENTENINMYDPNFSEKIEKLDKDKHYVIVCRSGGRSAAVTNRMRSMGFSNVHNLVGGIMSWSLTNDLVKIKDEN